ncbi:hypothetical protein K450DRAFT_243291 [Umbelopsis ramanniana AG]|uniref:CCHC-type domain-containing protein n=1 Tax=Umbelopsis ramanniana AG TaxID=1314678 RepID=A0AAD5HCH2_UMBRA|nr:uncharacterized protein K450DRAFT_243291 [Umbelopsis ramanniana AG]KAI8579210.1 hypothetical protein K450DRAFT_243291 [Umbelopsis ramanniana AG]
MTRYTKLGRKQHVDSGSWESAPLTPAKVKHPRSRDDGEQEGSGSGQNSGNKKRSFSKLDGQGEQRMSANEKRQKRRAVQKTTNTICFACRQRGHNSRDCPNSKEQSTGICYNCGSTEHSLKACKKPRNGTKLPFAKCYVCEGTGHLAGQCPKNEKGMYPNGGNCRFCGKVDHLAKDCKMTKEEAGTSVVGKIDLSKGADDDDFHIFVEEKQKLGEEAKVEKELETFVEKRKPQAKKKVVKF